MPIPDEKCENSEKATDPARNLKQDEAGHHMLFVGQREMHGPQDDPYSNFLNNHRAHADGDAEARERPNF